jgi:hypothetical protein
MLAEIGDQIILGMPFEESVVISHQDWRKQILEFTDRSTGLNHKWLGASVFQGKMATKIGGRRGKTKKRLSKQAQARGSIKLIAVKEIERYKNSSRIFVVNVAELDQILDDRGDTVPQLKIETQSSLLVWIQIYEKLLRGTLKISTSQRACLTLETKTWKLS